MRLKDKVAIVTGGGTGIGKAIATVFAGEGAKVVVAARTISRLEEAVKEIKAKGGDATAMQVDVSKEDQVNRMAADTIKKYGKIDIMVCNHAGGGGGGPLAELDLKGWQETMDINLTGTLLCCRAALKDMIPRKSGSIVNISSIAGTCGVPGIGSYATSKWAIIGMTQTMAVEVGDYNIRANSISPAATRTERFAGAYRVYNTTYEEMMKNLVGHYALRRVAEPEEIAKAALFLASDDSSAVTGQNLIVSCGFYAIHP
jgi:NAD(P)-dependent dehydrogenase (short-subunit alcohol dehydrogenase family)